MYHIFHSCRGKVFPFATCLKHSLVVTFVISFEEILNQKETTVIRDDKKIYFMALFCRLMGQSFKRKAMDLFIERVETSD